MGNEIAYTNREIDGRFTRMDEKLDLILEQTTKHNGRLKKVEQVLIIVGSVSGTILLLNGSELVKFVMAVI